MPLLAGLLASRWQARRVRQRFGEPVIVAPSANAASSKPARTRGRVAH